MSAKDVVIDAIKAHESWKLRLVNAIALGTLDADPAVVRTDNQCAFGKWLYGDSIADSEKRTETYSKVLALHAEFHRQAGAIAELAVTGKKDEARILMSAGGQYRKISTELVAILKIWDPALKS